MPDAALISALDELRESYGQRQKLTANLLAALKGAAGALGKAGKSLRDYAERSPGGADGAARALEALSSSRLRDEAIDPLLPGLRREAKLLAAQTAALKDAAAALRAETVDVIKLGHALAALQASKQPDPAVAALLPRLEEELELGQRALGDTFGLTLRQPKAFRNAPSKHAFADYSRAPFAHDFFAFTGRRPQLHQGLRAFGLVAT